MSRFSQRGRRLVEVRRRNRARWIARHAPDGVYTHPSGIREYFTPEAVERDFGGRDISMMYRHAVSAFGGRLLVKDEP